MSSTNGLVERVRASMQQHRKKLMWCGIAVGVYALLGFLLVPWLIQTQVPKVVADKYAAELRLEEVAFNPFVLSLRINGIELDDPQAQPVLRVAGIFANFQLSSIFRRAWTFAELRATAPEISLARDAAGDLNIGFLLAQEEPAEAVAETESGGSIPRLMVFTFAIDESAINWHDAVPVEPVSTRFGPIDIGIEQLNTLPNREGQQAVSITTESTGTLSWSGSLQLNPLRSVAHASIKGSHFPLTSAYIQHQTGFQILEGNADAELDYSIDTLADGSISAVVDNISLSLENVLISTFAGAGFVDEDREVLRIPGLHLRDGSLRWPEKTVSFAAAAIDDAALSLHRNKAGELNIVPKRAPSDAPEGAGEAPQDPPTNEGGAWQIALDNFAINRLSAVLDDESVTPQAQVGFSSLDLNVDSISNAAGASFPTQLAVAFREGGTLTSNGEIAVLPDLTIDLGLKIDQLVLASAQAYVKALADVSLDSGALNVDGRLAVTPVDPLAFNGDVAIVNFEVTETDEGTRLGSWDSLAAETIEFSLEQKSLAISELVVDRPYGDIVIAEDGSLNVGRVSKSDASADAEDESEPAAAEPKEPAAKDGGSTFAVTIGRVSLNNAAADFADFSLPLPFDVSIAELNGSMSTISTESRDPSTVALEGKVDEFGFVQVSGTVTPLQPALNTDMTVLFQNIQMPKFTSYTVPFAGREIASGSLDLQLGYQVADSQLLGENNIVLRELELGDKVEHPGAASLPLGLAVALLKDPEGKIDIDLPVRGDLNDPQFSYGSVIGKALGNLIVKIVASPFALLGKLIGVEASDLEYIQFIDGRADLTPPEQQRVGKIVEALNLRPQLILELEGVVDREADGLALRVAKLDELVATRMATDESANAADGMFSEQQREVLEDLFDETLANAEAGLTLKALRTQFTVAATAEDGTQEKPVFDELAYANDIRRQLIEAQAIAEEEYVALATARRDSVKAAVIAADALLEPRIREVQSKAVTREPDEMIQMKVNITAED